MYDDEHDRTKKRKRSCWVSAWLQNRPKEGACDKLLPELRAGQEIERKLYSDFHCLNEADFDYLQDLVAPLIRKQETNMGMAIPTKVRLELTLHFLVTGNSYSSLQFLFRLPQCTISKIVPDTLDAQF